MNPWEHVSNVVKWLNRENGYSSHEEAMRLLKVQEEAGEAAQAYLGLHGQNPRKGGTHYRSDVAEELCDVMITAMVSLHGFTTNPEEFFNSYVERRSARLEKSEEER